MRIRRSSVKTNLSNLNLCLYSCEAKRYNEYMTCMKDVIDGLHQIAGSQTVYEIHGSIHRNYCTHCHTFYDLATIISAEGIPQCTACGHVIKPDVVLYGEKP